MTGGDQPSVIVLGLNYAPEHTGIAPYTTGLARHLASDGFPTKAVVGYPHYPSWELNASFREKRRDRVEDGVRLIRMRHPVPASGAGLRRIFMEAVFALQVGRRLVRHEADVVVAVSPALLTVLPALVSGRLRRHGVGVVVQDLYGAALTETGMGGGMLTRLTAWAEFQLLSRADGIVVIHDIFQRRLVEAGLDPRRIRIIPNWSHVNVPPQGNRAAVRRRLGWQDDDIIALHAGNMGVKQGLEGLVDVARQAETTGSRVRVVLMGDGSQRARIETLGRNVPGLDVVDALPTGDFEAALASADVLLLHEKPGVVEMSVPSKLTSYFAAGRPIVAATDPRSGAAQLMAAAEAGQVVHAGQASAILSAIESIAQDPDRAAAFGTRARTFATEQLAASSSLRRYSHWVRSLA